MKKPLIYNALSLAVLFFLVQPGLAWSADGPSPFVQHPQLQEGQDRMSNAMADYYTALMSGSASQKKAAEDSINQAQSNMTRIYAEAHQAEINTITGKAYMMDGRVVDLAEFKKNPEKYNATGQSGGQAVAHATGNDTDANSNSRKSKGIVDDTPQNQVALDGKNIPKLLDFSKKKKASPAAAQVPNP